MHGQRFQGCSSECNPLRATSEKTQLLDIFRATTALDFLASLNSSLVLHLPLVGVRVCEPRCRIVGIVAMHGQRFQGCSSECNPLRATSEKTQLLDIFRATTALDFLASLNSSIVLCVGRCVCDVAFACAAPSPNPCPQACGRWIGGCFFEGNCWASLPDIVDFNASSRSVNSTEFFPE